jgi:hypothetical protein
MSLKDGDKKLAYTDPHYIIIGQDNVYERKRIFPFIYKIY